MMAIGRYKHRLVILVIFIISSGFYLAMVNRPRWTSEHKIRGDTWIRDQREANRMLSGDLTVQPVILNSSTTDDGPRYHCDDDDDDDDDVVENELALYGKPVYEKNKNVLYISMPKCGSRTFVWMISLLRKEHNFGKPINIEYLLGKRISEARENLKSKLREAEEGAIIHGHFRYINMNGSARKPILMSMIRDPIDRFESHFYFMRHGDMDMSKEFLLKRLRPNPNMALPNETLDDCVEKEREECTVSLYRSLYITSFCGYDTRCSNSQAFALEQAKLNVDKFLVIGVMEEYDLSMAVFEKLLPQTFGGAAKIYEESKSKPMEIFKTTYKKLPSQKTYSILKERMKYDYEFYDYVKKRLHKVARRLDIGQCSSWW